MKTNNQPPFQQILVVDDNRELAFTTAMLLKLQGHQVNTCYSGQQALEAAESLRPEVILLDLAMPGMDGYQTAELIRQQPWGKNLVLIALSGYNQDNPKQEQQSGFDAHLVKPLDLATVTQVIADQLTKRI